MVLKYECLSNTQNSLMFEWHNKSVGEEYATIFGQGETKIALNNESVNKLISMMTSNCKNIKLIHQNICLPNEKVKIKKDF